MARCCSLFISTRAEISCHARLSGVYYRRKVFYGEKEREIGAILREFWCRGYYVDTVGKNTKKIAEYIANQLKEDKMVEQMSMSELLDPFKQ